MEALCAVLAAGASTRMGSPKALVRVGERSLLERALAACGGRRTALVVSSAVAATLGELPATVTVVSNDEPERGMSRSLALAHGALGESAAALIVLLVDTPFVDAPLVARLIDALGAADVAYPVRDDVPGHPVVFGPRARARIAALAPGDTLRALRDASDLRRITVQIVEDGPFVDVDTPSDLARIRET